MKTLKTRVRWNKEWANDPYLEVLVDKLPKQTELRYQKIGNWLYFAELDGYVSFFCYTGPSDGFGGSVFELTMTDGTKEDLQGPWSSRAGAVNAEVAQPVLDVSLTDDPTVFEHGHTFYAGHATKASVEAALAPELELIPVDKGGETVWIPVLRGKTVKESKELSV